MFGANAKAFLSTLAVAMGLQENASNEEIQAWVAESVQHRELNNSLAALFGEQAQEEDFDLHASVEGIINTNADLTKQVKEFETVAAAGPAASRKKGNADAQAGDSANTKEATSGMTELTGVSKFNLTPVE